MHWNPAIGIPLIVVGLIVLGLIWLFGQPRKPHQGRRTAPTPRDSRREPSLDGQGEDDAQDEDFSSDADTPQPHQGELQVGVREELERLGATLSGEPAAQDETLAPLRGTETAAQDTPRPASPPVSHLGRRPDDQPVERIVSLFLVAREGRCFHGANLVVAMEKAGLEFGDMRIYHRLLDGKPGQGPVFSVANMVKPGSFDMTDMGDWETPGLSFFMTLPGPLPALDAWDMMLPTAQRLERLLDGQLLDEERNALGRQRIAHLRDDLRGWDRRHEVN